jgi:predicted RNA methylase
MNALLSVADTLPATPLAASGDSAAVHAAALLILPHLERGARVDAVALRDAMEAAFGGSDAAGLWDWKTAYEACEVATVLFLRKYGKTLFRKTGSPVAALPLLGKIADLLPTHTRRSQESQALQQFSTPIPLGLVAATAAAITPADRVLEPSAGTGLLAIFAEVAGGSLVLNELADTRAALLSSLFPAIPVTRFDAAQIDDHLDAATVPSVVLMNPPFSAMVHVEGPVADAAFRHVASALARLAAAPNLGEPVLCDSTRLFDGDLAVAANGGLSALTAVRDIGDHESFPASGRDLHEKAGYRRIAEFVVALLRGCGVDGRLGELDFGHS